MDSGERQQVLFSISLTATCLGHLAAVASGSLGLIGSPSIRVSLLNCTCLQTALTSSSPCTSSRVPDEGRLN
jgi:hypothetical protein